VSPWKGAQQPLTFRLMSSVAKRSPISATAELLLNFLNACVDHVVVEAESRSTMTSAGSGQHPLPICSTAPTLYHVRLAAVIYV